MATLDSAGSVPTPHTKETMDAEEEAPAVGAPGAAAETTVLLAVRALGTNAARVAEPAVLLAVRAFSVARADQERDAAWDERDAVLDVVNALAVTDAQKEDGLVRAAGWGQDGAVALLLADGVDPDTTASDALGEEGLLGCTALMAAAYRSHPACVEALLVGGAAVNTQDEDNWTALHFAARGDLEVGNPQSRDRRAASVVALLLEAGADKTLVGRGGTTALMLAAYCSHLACAKALLAGGTAVNVQNEFGLTALHYAAQGNLNDADPQSRNCRAAHVVAVLLEAGAIKTPVNVDGETAL